MTLLLLLVIVVIYNDTVGGTNGTGELVQQGGTRINKTIERINP